MEGGGIAEKQSSYTYWVRETTDEAAPLPAPRKLSAQDISTQSQSATSLGSVWNRAGTWEEKNLNSWASSRIKVSLDPILHPVSNHAIKPQSEHWNQSLLSDLRTTEMVWTVGPLVLVKELLSTLGSLEFSSGKAEIAEVSKCTGDAYLVTVRNKKRVGYTYELTLKFEGEWLIQEERKKIKGHIDIPEFSFGEVDDLEIEIRLSEEKDIVHQDKHRINQDLKQFLQPVREKLLQFEQELKER